MIDKRPKIIDVERKPQKCPVCGERVVDIIYGTGDMTEIEYFLEYRKEGMMGGQYPAPTTDMGVCMWVQTFQKGE